jgi:hypothetical protein
LCSINCCTGAADGCEENLKNEKLKQFSHLGQRHTAVCIREF